MRLCLNLVSIIFLVFYLTGCATMIKGYESKIKIKNAPALKKITDQNNQNIPFKIDIHNESIKKLNMELKKLETLGSVDTTYTFNLRSGKEYWLNLKTKGETKSIHIYPKISFGWALLDVITGVLPAFIDAYTGNWCHYDDINFESKKTETK